MKGREIASYREQMRKILQEPDQAKRIQELKRLAAAVGAGTENTKIAIAAAPNGYGGIKQDIHKTPITEYDLTSGINQALQTETMINVARRSFRISMVAAVIAAVSAAGAWAAVVRAGKDARYALSSHADRAYVLDTRTGQLWVRDMGECWYLGTNEDPTGRLTGTWDPIEEWHRWHRARSSVLVEPSGSEKPGGPTGRRTRDIFDEILESEPSLSRDQPPTSEPSAQ